MKISEKRMSERKLWPPVLTTSKYLNGNENANVKIIIHFIASNNKYK